MKSSKRGTVEAALEILGNARFDLLITDMVMPKVGGTVVMRAVRAEEPNIPVVCISVYTLESVVHEVESIENLIFLAMPFSLKQLAGTVRIAIDISLKNAE
ncbi:MAG: response regulator [Pseudomonadota bacterium]|nr:response regulator [Pseudomonadota bacterium]